MGKGKGSSRHEPSSDAYQRINYLYQASLRFAEVSQSSSLSAYYGHLAKETTKKIVGKIHPDIKRSLCKACSNPLTVDTCGKQTVIVPYKKKKRKIPRGSNRPAKVKKEDITSSQSSEEPSCSTFEVSSQAVGNSEPLEENLVQKRTANRRGRINQRERHPNRLVLNCNKCGYVRMLLQRPYHSLWIDSEQSRQA